MISNWIQFHNFVYQIISFLCLTLFALTISVSNWMSYLLLFYLFFKIEKDFHTGYGISMDDDEDAPLV